ncbi:ATP synthase subunit O, mitochondrial isoform X2 [Cryptomeria japonica]|uniref:ATP synthase subunit O, mitochondrial isoform X2 n=1 Tax=Cryptomeria japonica TaxID=3369 RepID=UPI0027DAB161|nr:ATP synthase subunit O, mitochondrial isoform X2 [Cryptomeria japonica]
MAMMSRAFQLSRMVARAAAPARRSPLPAFSQPAISRTSIFQVPRNFSTGKQLEEAYIKVPIPMYGVTGNYASALYIAAVKADKLEAVQSELKSIMEASKASPAFQNFMKDLSIPSKIRVKAVTEIFQEARFSDITKNFLATVAEHGRLRLLEGILKKFKRLTMAHFREVDVIVTTAIPLPEKEEKDLRNVVVNLIGEGVTVRLEQKDHHQ